jgi:hypothetical protein
LVVIDEIIEIACACARNAISALRHIMPMASGIALASTIGKLAFVSGFTISLTLFGSHKKARRAGERLDSRS